MIGLERVSEGRGAHRRLWADDYGQGARDLAGQYRDILGAENFYLEMHDHGIEAQLKVNAALPRLGMELGLPNWSRRTMCIF